MKTIPLLLVLCLLLTACSFIPAEPVPHVTQTPTTGTTQSPTVETTMPSTQETTAPLRYILNIYCPNENSDGFTTVSASVDQLDPNFILDSLIQYSMLNSEIALNRFGIADGQIQLDFNTAFQDQLKTYGSTGENMMIGCVVNTYLDNYEAETVIITVDGQILESGHVIYDFPIRYVK